jgi:hypothetical protein
MAKKPAKGGAADSESIRVRKIRNGYVTTRIGTSEGKFFKTEEYSRKQPVIAATRPAKAPAAASAPTRRPRAAGTGNEVGYLRRA